MEVEEYSWAAGTGAGTRYDGINGQEEDEEIFKGSYSAEYWNYDSRIGRRWNVDPVDQVSISNYATFANNPILFIDSEGNSPLSYFAKKAAKEGIKVAAKQFIRQQVKKRVRQYMSKTWAMRLAKDADGVLTVLDGSWGEFFIEMTPWVGDVYSGISLTAKGKKLWNRLRYLEKRAEFLSEIALKYSDKVVDLIDLAIEGRSFLRKTMNFSGIAQAKRWLYQAHHIIPVDLLKNNEVVQKAVGAGFKFNERVNGVLIKTFDETIEVTGNTWRKARKHNKLHGSHPKYTENVNKIISDWAKQNKGYTPEQAKEFLEGLSGELKSVIKSETNVKKVKLDDLNLDKLIE